MQVVAPMEESFFAFAALLYAALLLLAVGIAQGSQTWEMEDPPYVNVNLRVKPVREVDRKQPTPLQTKDRPCPWTKSLRKLQSLLISAKQSSSIV